MLIMGNGEMRMPPSLRRGDKVAIVSPASKIEPGLIDAAVGQLQREELEVVVMPHAKGVCGSFSGSREERLEDMHRAMEDDTVRCILCSRGGYGAVHLLDELDRLPGRCFDKWLVGFSDITALHALWWKHGVVSMHGAMAKYIGMGEEFPFYRTEIKILRGGDAGLECAADGFNREGVAEGKIVGGNLAVMGGLIGTPFDPVEDGCILFIEDIAEPIYKVERILWQLRLRGVFDRLGGLMVGQFTDYRPSADWHSMEAMIASFVKGYRFPVAMNLPVGHIDNNHPLLLNRRAKLAVGAEGVMVGYG